MLRRFVATILLPGVVLLGFGLRTLQQDQAATNREVRDRLQRAAELGAQSVDRQLANWRDFKPDGVTIRMTPEISIRPRNRIAYFPNPAIQIASFDRDLVAAEQEEQVRGDLSSAIVLYSRVVKTGSPHIRAIALERLAECYRKAGMGDDTVKAWRQLLKLDGEQIGSVDAGLIARFELALLDQGDRAAFYHDLAGGRWKLDKPHYLFYSETAREWVPSTDAQRVAEPDKLAFAEAVEQFVSDRRHIISGYVAFWDQDEALIVPASMLRARLERAANLDPLARVRLADRSSSDASAQREALNNRDLPWVVEAVLVDAGRYYSAANQRRLIYLSLLLLVFALLLSGTYVTARAVKRELEVARLKSDFVATVSHEFRSPLTAIRQLSELLQRGRVATDEKRQEYYALISRESSRLSRLVENLLDFSRIEEGRRNYLFERFEPAAWLQDIVNRFDTANVTLCLPSEMPPITADRVALSSAVENLVDNAIKYSPAGAPIVCRAEVKGYDIVISVQDEGYGITPEDRQHIFEKFYRGKREIHQEVKGAGVGLSLVRQIVEGHGGRVDFESRPGGGSTFRIHLTAAPASTAGQG